MVLTQARGAGGASPQPPALPRASPTHLCHWRHPVLPHLGRKGRGELCWHLKFFFLLRNWSPSSVSSLSASLFTFIFFFFFFSTLSPHPLFLFKFALLHFPSHSSGPAKPGFLQLPSRRTCLLHILSSSKLSVTQVHRSKALSWSCPSAAQKPPVAPHCF